MRTFTKKDIDGMDKIYRLNMINSITGYKSANLIGTQSASGIANLAVFSSVIHLGSQPPLLGFILRPTTVPRHTYQNLKANGIFTVNHIHADQIADAHHTSAKYPADVSEFDHTQLDAQYHSQWPAPFVKDAPIQLACLYQNEYPIEENGTILIVGSIETIYLKDDLLMDDGWIRLDRGNIVAINGLDGYAKPELIERFAYARPKKV